MLSGDPRLHVAFVTLLVGTQAVFSWLAIRNVTYSARRVDEEREWLSAELDVEDPAEIVAYNRTKTAFAELRSWIGLAFLLVLLYTGAFTAVVELLEDLGLGMLPTGVVFFVGAMIGVQAFGLPFDAVDTFVVEELFDFNEQTPRLWLRDAVVSLLIGAVLTAVIAAAILGLIVALPDLWWALGAVVFVGFAVVMQIVYPRVIAPLFNDFEPIESGELRDAVEDVFERAGFRCDELYSMDASRRSRHVNAYFVGFGRTKRVVLFDTLIDRMERPEIQSVLAHELAHWQERHVWKRLLVSAVRIGAVLLVLWWLLSGPWLYDMFALPDSATYGALVVGMLFVGPLMQWTAPIPNRVSLAHERAADRFAVEVMGDGAPMADALARLGRENLANPFPHPLYATFHYTHPPIPERIRRIRDAG